MKQTKNLGVSGISSDVAADNTGEVESDSGHVLEFERSLMQRLLTVLGDPPLRFVLWNGEDFCTSTKPVVANFIIKQRTSFYRLLINPELYFGDDYSAGRIDVQGNLVTALNALYDSMNDCAYRSFWTRYIMPLLNRPRRNTLRGSKDNIHAHYDLGNDFYKLWLDDQMLYTCAYFETADSTLEQAQIAKMDHVCRKLQLKAGETVVEAGCGWGTLARHMTRHYGVKVKAFNISSEQIKYAREQADAEGLTDRIEYIEDDYRNVTGEFDVFVSVGMLEHVGPAQYRTLGGVIDRCLHKHGRGLIHSVGRNRDKFVNAWLERRIFPGAYPPSLRECMDIFEPHNFSVLDVENLRLHYALTLVHWLQRFELNNEKVREMYGEAFIRAWRLYLAGCSASFSAGFIQLYQILFNRGTDNDIAWTRAHIYKD